MAGNAILAAQSDDRLVELVRSGHERAFEAIVARYRRPLVRFSGQILPESRAEDAVQQALVNAHAALVGGDDPVQLRPWLYAITRNAALNLLRQNGWNHEQIPADFDGVRRPDQVVEQRIELQRTVAAVNALPDRQRDAIVMREFEGRSYQEIALALGAGDGAVRQLLNRARGTLRDAVSLLMPPPLVARVASSLPPSDGRRTAEVLGGLGAAGLAKAGATAVMAGSLVVGAAQAPLPLVHDGGAKRERATLAHNQGKKPDGAAAAALMGDNGNGSARANERSGGTRGERRRGTERRAHARGDDRRGQGGRSGPGAGGSEHGDDRPGPRHRESDDRRSSGDRRESPDRSGSSAPSGSESERSGASEPDTSDDRSGSGNGSGADDSVTAEEQGGSLDHSVESSGPGSGSTDVATTVTSAGTSGSGDSSSSSGPGDLLDDH